MTSGEARDKSALLMRKAMEAKPSKENDVGAAMLDAYANASKSQPCRKLAMLAKAESPDAAEGDALAAANRPTPATGDSGVLGRSTAPPRQRMRGPMTDASITTMGDLEIRRVGMPKSNGAIDGPWGKTSWSEEALSEGRISWAEKAPDPGHGRGSPPVGGDLPLYGKTGAPRGFVSQGKRWGHCWNSRTETPRIQATRMDTGAAPTCWPHKP